MSRKFPLKTKLLELPVQVVVLIDVLVDVGIASGGKQVSQFIEPGIVSYFQTISPMIDRSSAGIGCRSIKWEVERFVTLENPGWLNRNVRQQRTFYENAFQIEGPTGYWTRLGTGPDWALDLSGH